MFIGITIFFWSQLREICIQLEYNHTLELCGVPMVVCLDQRELSVQIVCEH